VTYLLDTNILSEHTRRVPDARVIEWTRSTPIEHQFMSVLSLGEVRYGIERLTVTAKREQLRNWLETDLRATFGDRLLPVTAAIAELWARLRAEVRRSVPTVDSLLAATALHHDLRLVTRNEKDFAPYPGLLVVNPWRQ
jgi:toxin FitB